MVRAPLSLIGDIIYVPYDSCKVRLHSTMGIVRHFMVNPYHKPFEAKKGVLRYSIV